MLRIVQIFFLSLALWAGAAIANAGTYTLKDGSQISGAPLDGFNEAGVVFKADDGSFLPRTPWENFSQQALRQLLSDAKTAHDKGLIEPLLEELPEEKAKNKQIEVQPVQNPYRPAKPSGIFGVFTSPVGLLILLILYGANLFAAYEVALFRNQPLTTVCGLAAIPILGVFSPIVYIAMPTRTAPIEPPAPAAGPIPVAEIVPEGTIATEPTAEELAAATAAPALPPAVVFARGDFAFNRRFFETKLAGFFRLVPSGTDKDMVVWIKSSRGDFTGKRITRISPTDLHLQVFKNEVTADEMIPFIEILEVQIRHKDSL